jgi:hypothetical protein
VICLAPRALEDSVRPRRLADVGARPLNFTVRSRMANASPAALTAATRRLRLLRLIANFALPTALAYVVGVGLTLHFFPSLIPLGPMTGSAVVITGVALATASFISTASFRHGVATCPRCGQRFLRSPYALWVPRRCQYCRYDVVTGSEGDF